MRLPGNGMSWKEFGVGLKDEVAKDNVTDLAATVTYYGVLALFPFLLFLVALASLVISPQQAEEIVRQLSEVAPGAVTDIVGQRIQQLGEQQNVGLLGFGALGALWAASNATLAVTRALNTCYDVQESRPFWKVRGLAVIVTVVASVLALAAALVAVAAAPVAEAIGGPVGAVVTWLRLPVAGVVMMLLWAIVYWALPDVQQSFRFISPGSIAGVLLWVLASWAFSRYVANFGSYDKTYGSIAGIIVLLLWMWISALVMLVGAEVNALIEHASPEGKRQGARSLADDGVTPAHEREAAGRGGEGTDRTAAQGGARGRPARGGRREERGPLRGLAALAAGFAAGLLVARRES